MSMHLKVRCIYNQCRGVGNSQSLAIGLPQISENQKMEWKMTMRKTLAVLRVAGEDDAVDSSASGISTLFSLTGRPRYFPAEEKWNFISCILLSCLRHILLTILYWVSVFSFLLIIKTEKMCPCLAQSTLKHKNSGKGTKCNQKFSIYWTQNLFWVLFLFFNKSSIPFRVKIYVFTLVLGGSVILRTLPSTCQKI